MAPWEDVLGGLQESLTFALCAPKDSLAAQLILSLQHVKSIKYKSFFFCIYQVVLYAMF